MKTVKFPQSDLEQMIYIDDFGKVCHLDTPNEYHDYVFEDRGHYFVVHLSSKQDGLVIDSFVCYTSKIHKENSSISDKP